MLSPPEMIRYPQPPLQADLPPGMLLAIVGPMFAGKTTRLMRYAEEAFDKGRKVVIIRSIQDKRNGPVQEGLKTYNGRGIQWNI